jgi:magnesium-transporting ATPase (P-type)
MVRMSNRGLKSYLRRIRWGPASREPVSKGGRDAPQPAWHAMMAKQVTSHLAASREGLSHKEAALRLTRYGPNVLPAAAQKSALRRFIAQFDNVLIYVLLGSAAITALLGHGIDTAVILLVVLLNAIIGYIQEGRAEKALEAISKMISPKASVLREGHRLTVDAADLVQGDLLILEPGDRVSADVRLMKARNLRIDEAALTGESVAVDKSTDPVAADALLGDRNAMAYSGTLVTAGQGTGIVVATGVASELGRISLMLGRVEQLVTPLIRQMNLFAKQLTVAILGLCAATVAFAVFVRSYTLGDAFMAAVGMAVAAIPEGLPAVMTITLAIGVQRMASRNAIIRRLPAVETLGSVSVICSDKTGTLTKNEMTVRVAVLAEATYEVGGVGYAPKGGFSIAGRDVDPASEPALMRLALAALLCNEASLLHRDGVWSVAGDPMEGALVAFAVKAGHDPGAMRKQRARLDEIPFEAQNRYMATLHRSGEDGALIVLKGAPERVLEMCDRQAGRTADTSIDRRYWNSSIDQLASEGHRVVALAMKSMPAGTTELDFADVHNDNGLLLLGIVGLIDPPREEAIEAVRECGNAGIRVKMITGDHRATAQAIARQLGLVKADSVATGHSLDKLDAQSLGRVARVTTVFARTSPLNKLQLVEALQADGNVVAMTGDGVNDAPALKRADIGVAMGEKGTEVAKEAADMLLADDNFASIVAAVREGRIVYDNLIKVIAWTLPTSLGETLIIAAAILLGWTLPVTPVQILWINTVTVGALGLVLAFEPAEADVMRRPPRIAREPLLSGFLIWRIAFVSILFAIIAFAIFGWAEQNGRSDAEARTIVVNTIVVMEVFYLFSVRYLRMTSLTLEGLFGTRAVLLGVASIIVLQLAFTYTPVMRSLFDTRPMTLVDGVVVLGAGLLLFVVLEIEKLLRRYAIALFARP